jgi:hypothetical protein
MVACDGGPTGIMIKSNWKPSMGNRWNVCYAFTSVPKLFITTSFLSPPESLPPLWHLLDKVVVIINTISKDINVNLVIINGIVNSSGGIDLINLVIVNCIVNSSREIGLVNLVIINGIINGIFDLVIVNGIINGILNSSGSIDLVNLILIDNRG